MTRLERLTKNPTPWLVPSCFLFTVPCEPKMVIPGNLFKATLKMVERCWKIYKTSRNLENHLAVSPCVLFILILFLSWKQNHKSMFICLQKTEVAFWRLTSTPQISRRFEKKKIRHFSGITHLLLWNTLGRKLWAFFKLSEFSNNSSTKKTLQVSHFCSSSFHNNQSFLPFICWMLWIPVPNMAGQLLHVFPRGDLSCAVASKFGCPNLPWKLKEGQWGLSIGSIDLWMYLSVRMQKTWHDILCYHNVHYIYLYMYIFVE